MRKTNSQLPNTASTAVNLNNNVSNKDCNCIYDNGGGGRTLNRREHKKHTSFFQLQSCCSLLITYTCRSPCRVNAPEAIHN